MNPSKSELLDDISTSWNIITTNTGELTNSEIDSLLNSVVNVFNNLDPDRKVKIKQRKIEATELMVE